MSDDQNRKVHLSYGRSAPGTWAARRFVIGMVMTFAVSISTGIVGVLGPILLRVPHRVESAIALIGVCLAVLLLGLGIIVTMRSSRI